MCDYSLHTVATRPAVAGDELVTTAFRGTGTRGFCAPGEPNVAVCLRPGTEVAFEREAECDHPFARVAPRFRFGKIGAMLARFRQIDTDRAHVHHDALEFANGKIVPVTKLSVGQRARVLQLPVEPVAGGRAAAQPAAPLRASPAG